VSLEGFTWFLYHAPSSAFFPQEGFTWFLYHACKAALAVPLAASSCMQSFAPPKKNLGYVSRTGKAFKGHVLLLFLRIKNNNKPV